MKKQEKNEKNMKKQEKILDNLSWLFALSCLVFMLILVIKELL